MPSRSTGSYDAPLSFPPTRGHVPVRSTWATTGTADSMTSSAAMPGFSNVISPPRRTGRRIPLAPVGFLLEYRRGQPDVGQIPGIFDLRRDREPLLTIRPLVEIPVLGQHGVLAVGNAVLAQVSRAKVRGDDSQRSTGRAKWRRVRGAIRRPELQRYVRARSQPLGFRDALPGARRVRRLVRLHVAESQESRLHPRIGIHLDRGVVLPGDVNPPGNAHQRGRAV